MIRKLQNWGVSRKTHSNYEDALRPGELSWLERPPILERPPMRQGGGSASSQDTQEAQPLAIALRTSQRAPRSAFGVNAPLTRSTFSAKSRLKAQALWILNVSLTRSSLAPLFSMVSSVGRSSPRKRQGDAVPAFLGCGRLQRPPRWSCGGLWGPCAKC